MTGTAYWNMWDVLKYMLDQYPDNHGARFGIFLCAVTTAMAYLAGKSTETEPVDNPICSHRRHPQSTSPPTLLHPVRI